MRRRDVLVAAAGAGVLARPALARAQDSPDADVLARSLHVEHTSMFVYDAVAAANVLDGEASERLRRLRDHEKVHASALVRAVSKLGGPLPAFPRGAAEVQLPQIRAGLDALDEARDATDLLIELERVSLDAHRAGIARLRETQHLQLLATILATDATHLAAWRAVG